MQFRDTLKVKYHGIYFKVLQKKKKKGKKRKKIWKNISNSQFRGSVY